MGMIAFMQNTRRSSRFTAFLMLSMLLFIAVEGYSQKKDSKKTPKKAENSPLTESDLLEGEYYFIEGEKYFILDNYEKAYESFLQAFSKNPKNGAINYKLAEVLVLNGEYSKALPYALQAMASDPSNKYYYLSVANIYTSLSNFTAAIETYEKLLANVAGSETHLFELAALYMYQKNLDQALTTYDRAKAAFGPMEQVTVQKQKIYLSMNRLEDAIREGDELIEAFPEYNELLLNQAEILISTEKYDRAEGYLIKMLDAEPNHPQASILLSEIYRNKGDEAKSAELLQSAFSDPKLNFDVKIQLFAEFMIKLPNASLEPLLVRLSELLVEAHPDESNAYAISGDLFFQLGQNDKALRNYKRALDSDKSNFGLWQNVLNIEMSLEKYDSVAIVAEEAIEYFPNQSAVYYYGGTAYLIQKKYKESITMFEQGVKYVGANPELTSVFYGQLGDAYNAISDHKKSDASYEKALQAQPDNDHVLNNFSYFLSLRKEQLPRAQEMSKILVEKYPDNSTYLDTHAWVLYVMGNYKEARKYLEMAVEDENASGTIVEHYGDVLYKLNEVNAAVEQWEKAKKLGDASSNLNKKIAEKKLYE